MRCLYCDKRIWNPFTTSKFCSELHQTWFEEEHSGEAIRRLVDTPILEPVVAIRRIGEAFEETEQPLAAAGAPDSPPPLEAPQPPLADLIPSPPEYAASPGPSLVPFDAEPISPVVVLPGFLAEPEFPVQQASGETTLDVEESPTDEDDVPELLLLIGALPVEEPAVQEIEPELPFFPASGPPPLPLTLLDQDLPLKEEDFGPEPPLHTVVSPLAMPAAKAPTLVSVAIEAVEVATARPVLLPLLPGNSLPEDLPPAVLENTPATETLELEPPMAGLIPGWARAAGPHYEALLEIEPWTELPAPTLPHLRLESPELPLRDAPLAQIEQTAVRPDWLELQTWVPKEIPHTKSLTPGLALLTAETPVVGTRLPQADALRIHLPSPKPLILVATEETAPLATMLGLNLPMSLDILPGAAALPDSLELSAMPEAGVVPMELRSRSTVVILRDAAAPLVSQPGVPSGPFRHPLDTSREPLFAPVLPLQAPAPSPAVSDGHAIALAPLHMAAQPSLPKNMARTSEVLPDELAGSVPIAVAPIARWIPVESGFEATFQAARFPLRKPLVLLTTIAWERASAPPGWGPIAPKFAAAPWRPAIYAEPEPSLAAVLRDVLERGLSMVGEISAPPPPRSLPGTAVYAMVRRFVHSPALLDTSIAATRVEGFRAAAPPQVAATYALPIFQSQTADLTAHVHLALVPLTYRVIVDAPADPRDIVCALRQPVPSAVSGDHVIASHGTVKLVWQNASLGPVPAPVATPVTLAAIATQIPVGQACDPRSTIPTSGVETIWRANIARPQLAGSSARVVAPQTQPRVPALGEIALPRFEFVASGKRTTGFAPVIPSKALPAVLPEPQRFPSLSRIAIATPPAHGTPAHGLRSLGAALDESRKGGQPAVVENPIPKPASILRPEIRMPAAA